ncbi:MAG: TetR family transcriptional regulator [Anaerolineae bacterium]|nr:TetR family transcriptional regulator [Anaerolineae bacterium]NIN99514.1 TetR family transcriptional regulator [Anaerolineae bacterium]NIQ82378.1 TetR family transcriptional regulator [Anaerolineae bacterium]
MPEATERANKRQLLREQREAQILDAAARVFAKNGYARATTREIAAEAGVSEGTIYNYFDSKRDLLIAMSSRLALESLEQLDALPPREDVKAYVLALVKNRFHLLLKNIDLVRALMPEVLVDDDLRTAYINEVLAPAIHYLGKYIESRSEVGVFREVNTQVVARAMIGSVMSFGFLWLQQPSELEQVSREEVISEVVGLFLDGLRLRPDE